MKATAVVVAVYVVVAWKNVPFDTEPWLAVGPAVYVSALIGPLSRYWARAAPAVNVPQDSTFRYPVAAARRPTKLIDDGVDPDGNFDTVRVYQSLTPSNEGTSREPCVASAGRHPVFDGWVALFVCPDLSVQQPTGSPDATARLPVHEAAWYTVDVSAPSSHSRIRAVVMMLAG